MAVKFIEHIEEGILGFWEIVESTDQLFSLLKPNEEDLTGYIQFRNELRKKEWLAARLLLKQMAGSDAKIDYDTAGKPLLTNLPGHISISHSSNCVVLYYHPRYQPGIDIESISRNVERISRKFLSPGELEDCMINGQLSNKDLMLRWCAKEAVFKMVSYSDIDFASQIACISPPIIYDKGKFTANFMNNDTFLSIHLNFRLIDNILMVWGMIP